MNKHYVGIDPGKSGAISVIDREGNFLRWYSIPKIGDDIDLNAFYNIFVDIKNHANTDKAKIHICVEKVGAIFGVSSGSTFTFGYIVGLIDMMIVSQKIPYSKIQPKEWQKNCWITSEIEREPDKIDKNGKHKQGKIKTKIVSLKAAKRLFPAVNFHEELKNGKPAKNPHDGFVDSILIAECCRRLNH